MRFLLWLEPSLQLNRIWWKQITHRILHCLVPFFDNKGGVGRLSQRYLLDLTPDPWPWSIDWMENDIHRKQQTSHLANTERGWTKLFSVSISKLFSWFKKARWWTACKLLRQSTSLLEWFSWQLVWLQITGEVCSSQVANFIKAYFRAARHGQLHIVQKYTKALAMLQVRPSYFPLITFIFQTCNGLTFN